MKQVNHSLRLSLGLYSLPCLLFQLSQARFQLKLALLSLLPCLLLTLKAIPLRLGEGKEKGRQEKSTLKRLFPTSPPFLMLPSSPHHLSSLLFLGLGLHLLDLHGVQPPPTHVQIMVADTQLHNL